jgi:hypothetical protein
MYNKGRCHVKQKCHVKMDASVMTNGAGHSGSHRGDVIKDAKYRNREFVKGRDVM